LADTVQGYTPPDDISVSKTPLVGSPTKTEQKKEKEPTVSAQATPMLQKLGDEERGTRHRTNRNNFI
jgi:hypothetical protein